MTPTGIWNEPEEHFYQHVYSPKFADALTHILTDDYWETAYDVGCGMGWYGLILRRKHTIFMDGADQLGSLAPKVTKVDLSQPFVEDYPKGFVLCLEVGEHIPEKHQFTFLDNVCSLVGSRLILSWAIPGQEGYGHVNCKENWWVIKQVKKRGLIYNDRLSAYLRANAGNAGWFENSVMVFDKL